MSLASNLTQNVASTTYLVGIRYVVSIQIGSIHNIIHHRYSVSVFKMSRTNISSTFFFGIRGCTLGKVIYRVAVNLYSTPTGSGSSMMADNGSVEPLTISSVS